MVKPITFKAKEAGLLSSQTVLLNENMKPYSSKHVPDPTFFESCMCLTLNSKFDYFSKLGTFYC